jgi:UDP-glucose 4-epimerase
VGSDEEVSIGRLAERVIEILKSKSEIQFIPYEQAYAPGFEDMLRRKPLLERLERFAGFRPQRTLEEIIVSAAGLFALRVFGARSTAC